MTVVLTREAADNAKLASRLRAGGARVVELPCVRVEPLRDTRELASALAALSEEDWLVVTSRHGADAVTRLPAPRASVAAIGDATAARLRTHGLRVAFQPSAANGATLARELPITSGVVLLARSDRALPELPEALRERGIAVRDVVAYRTVAEARGDVAHVRALLASGERVAVVFHSPSAIEGMLAAIAAPLVARAAIRAAGRTTLRAARDAFGPAADVSLIEEEVAHVAHR
jgi:uroporphyrinogen III methyltransferase/synthase